MKLASITEAQLIFLKKKVTPAEGERDFEKKVVTPPWRKIVGSGCKMDFLKLLSVFWGICQTFLIIS